MAGCRTLPEIESPHHLQLSHVDCNDVSTTSQPEALQNLRWTGDVLRERMAALTYGRNPWTKPRGRSLHYQHLRADRKRARLPVEHALASVKRLGILRQPLRAPRRTMADAAILIGCALHHYRQNQKALAA